jgi:hypothetical protein
MDTGTQFVLVLSAVLILISLTLSFPETEVVHQVGIERPALRDSVPTLTPTMQIVAQSFKHVTVQLIEALAGMTVAEITTRAFQEAVHLGDQLTDRYKGSLPARERTDSPSSS